jgi:hypothetical protein
MKEAYRIRARRIIIQAYKQRLLLISTGRSKNDISHDQCTMVQNEVSFLSSDNQFAKYLIKRHGLIRQMIPACNVKTVVGLLHLLDEAYTIIHSEKSIFVNLNK